MSLLTSTNSTFFFNVFRRHFEKLADLFEKLRVKKEKEQGCHLMIIHGCRQNLTCFRFMGYSPLKNPTFNTGLVLCGFLQKVEGRVASDQELKLTELLRYYMRDIQAAKVRHVSAAASLSLRTPPANHNDCGNMVGPDRIGSD